MKKIKYLFFGLFMMFICNQKCYASQIFFSNTYDDLYVTKYDSKNDYSTNLKMFSDTNHILFSTEPLRKYPDNLSTYDIIHDSDSIDSFSKVIAYLADKEYQIDHDENWLKAGQHLIWQNNIANGTYYINGYDFRARDLILLSLYEEFSRIPTIDSATYALSDNNVTVEDLNDVLGYYDVVNIIGDSVTYTKNGKFMNFSLRKEGQTIFYLRRYFNEKDFDMNHYVNNNYTNFISAGNFYLEVKFAIDVVAGYIEINIPSELNNFNVKYGIYNDDVLVYTFNITKPGIYKSCNLKKGIYQVKQISNSNLYAKDDNVYEVKIDGIKNEIINLEPIVELKGNLNVNFHQTNNKLICIYDDNNNLVDYCLLDVDNINKDLPYGDYYMTIDDEKIDFTIGDEDTLITINTKIPIDEELINEEEKEIIEEVDNVLLNNSNNFENEVANEVSIDVPDTYKNSLLCVLLVAYIIKKYIIL